MSLFSKPNSSPRTDTVRLCKKRRDILSRDENTFPTGEHTGADGLDQGQEDKDVAEKLVSKGADLVGTLVSTTLATRSAGARSLALALRR